MCHWAGCPSSTRNHLCCWSSNGPKCSTFLLVLSWSMSSTSEKKKNKKHHKNVLILDGQSRPLTSALPGSLQRGMGAQGDPCLHRGHRLDPEPSRGAKGWQVCGCQSWFAPLWDRFLGSPSVEISGQEKEAALRSQGGEGRVWVWDKQFKTFVLNLLHCCFCAFAHPSPAFSSSLFGLFCQF